MDGVLVIDKPAGPTSHDVVARVRRILRTPRIGHTGTLDPMATGVLPLVVGRATRLARFFSGRDKDYDATIRLGLATDTYDAQGAPVGPGATLGAGMHAGPDPRPQPLPDAAAIARALDAFRGEFLQTPPPYSAKKIGGVRAYDLARRDRAVTPAAVAVHVSALDLLMAEGDAVRLRVSCSAGFYVRSLAHDLGAALGCGAHLAALRRLRSGEFDETAAVALADAERDPDAARDRLLPLRALLHWLPAAALSARGAERVSHGNPVGAEDIVEVVPGSGVVAGATEPDPAPAFRLLAPDGRFLAVAELAQGAAFLRPAVVLV